MPMLIGSYPQFSHSHSCELRSVEQWAAGARRTAAADGSFLKAHRL